jgi:SAM-dependent methyltransferase
VSPLITILRAVAEPTRLRILAVCAEGELTVSELVQILGQSQPRVSRHLKVLTDAGVLERVPEGNWVFHRIKPDGLAAEVVDALVTLAQANDEEAVLDRRRLAGVKAERQERADAYFRKNAPEWNALRALGVDEAQVDGGIEAILGGRPTGDLLDIGTGTGRMLQLLGATAHRAVGVDLSADMLSVARANLARAGLARCSVRKANMYQLPFGDQSFDTVAIHQVLHYADDPAGAIGEAARVLRPGGRLLLADYAPHAVESLRSEHHHRRLGFSDDEVRSWLGAAGLTLERIERLHGGSLTVVLWLGAAQAAPAALTAASGSKAAVMQS